MDIKSAKKRIKEAVKKLNAMENNLDFSFVEEDYYISLECHSKTRNGHHFGAFEDMQFFDDYVKKETAYVELMKFAEVMICASRLNDPKAYHNMVA